MEKRQCFLLVNSIERHLFRVVLRSMDNQDHHHHHDHHYHQHHYYHQTCIHSLMYLLDKIYKYIFNFCINVY